MRLFHTKKIAFLGVMAGVLFVLSYLENIVPVNFGVPGVKFGFSNIVIIVLLLDENSLVKSFKYPLMMTIIKIIIGTFVFGTISAFLFTFLGSASSFLSMYLAAFSAKGKIGAVGISVIGGFLHITAQYFSASIILSSNFVWSAYPLSALLTLVTSVITGMLAYVVIKRTSYFHYL